MATPTINLSADKRVPFDKTIAKMGVDYSGATMLCHIRNEPGDTGTPLVTLSNAAPPSEGLSVTYDASYPDPEGVLVDGASKVRMIVSEATLEALDTASPTSNALVLYYDIHLTPSGGTKFVFCSGKFTINPGVTV
ncbi:hypothetical protein INR77_08810 [Erythrobacter sp. SCSIO 43205]|uniref:hypothetical protein n=1 Tax=Erythrobacter sp. SCSIO 43205 TaxID=2779361 RepID=UPI001CA94EDA|nr:hypothetical protein [Erythrobacter sp. SCSIO 43205]UAB76947.1 hypothetical protein INR77_08810 [Erythrobacter sp. SCSIO 43205]